MTDRNMLLFKFLQAVQFFSLLFTTARATEDVVITYMDLPLSGGAAFDICWTSATAFFINAELTVIQVGVTEKPLTGTVTLGDHCATFDYLSLNVVKDTPVAFVLRLYNPLPFSVSTLSKEREAPDGQGMARIDLWPDVSTLVECDSAYKVAGELGTMTLRIHYTKPLAVGDILTADGSTHVGESDRAKNTVYYIFPDTPAPSSVKICREVPATINDEGGKTMDICKYPKEVLDATATAPSISEAVLDYTTLATTVSAMPVAGSTTGETIHYWESTTPGIYEFSSLCDYTLPCAVNPYTTGLKTLNIVLVGYEAPDELEIKEASRHPFQDFNVASSFLFSSTMEMMWEPSNTGSTSTFEITIDCGKPLVDGFPSATVTCDPNDSGCYGYFLGIPDDATACTSSLQPDIVGADPKNKITLTTDKYFGAHKTKRVSDLGIRHVKMEWHQNDLEAIALVCFNHTSYDAETDFSHYEFVMVNQKGQWLKHKLFSLDTVGDICFSSFTVNTNTFDVTGSVNLLVTQRATDGFAVLAAGETYISFNRNSSKSFY